MEEILKGQDDRIKDQINKLKEQDDRFKEQDQVIRELMKTGISAHWRRCLLWDLNFIE